MNLENVTYKIMFPKIRKKCFSLKSYPNIANINNKLQKVMLLFLQLTVDLCFICCSVLIFIKHESGSGCFLPVSIYSIFCTYLLPTVTTMCDGDDRDFGVREVLHQLQHPPHQHHHQHHHQGLHHEPDLCRRRAQKLHLP